MKQFFSHVSICVLLTAACCPGAHATSRQETIVTQLDGKTIQFSHSPACKFTPLLLACAHSEPGSANTYNLQEEKHSVQLTYTPDTARRTATIQIAGASDTAYIHLQFDNAYCGTAHMTWNRIKYYSLKFRIQDTRTAEGYLQRMGAPVGDVVPQSLAGKLLTLDFNGAVDREITQDNEAPQWKNSTATPFVIQFPADKHTFSVPSGMSDAEADPWPPLTVEYEPVGTAAEVSIRGRSCQVVIELDFADSSSGLAHVLWGMEEGSGWEAKCATFTLCDAPAKQGAVYWPHFPENRHADAELLALTKQLAARQYPTAVEELYKRRLLQVLPAIASGGDVNMQLPEANGTTALHNACGLSHAEIVRWLVEHGADLSARTAKGASVDDCVGGANAKAIRSILRHARAAKK